MMTKTIYLYDAITKEFISKYDAQESPLEKGVFLTPESSTAITPITSASGKFQYFNGTSWQLKDDTRGIWYDSTGISIEVDNLFTPISSDWLRTPPAKTLPQLKENKKTEIKNAFESNSNLPVLVSGVYWNGGFDSAIKLDAAMRLSQAAGQSNVSFFDINNLPHVLSFTDALIIVITVAGNYQYNLAKKQQLTVAIDSATIDTISSITW